MESKESMVDQEDTQNEQQKRKKRMMNMKIMIENEAVQDMMEGAVLEMKRPDDWPSDKDVVTEWRNSLEDYILEFIEARGERQGRDPDVKMSKAVAKMATTFLKLAMHRMNKLGIERVDDLYPILNHNDDNE